MPPKTKPTVYKCPGCFKNFNPSKQTKSLAKRVKVLCGECHKKTGKVWALSSLRRPRRRQPTLKPKPASNTEQSSRTTISRAMKSSARGTIIPLKSANNAEQFFMLQTLNPKATMGSRTIRMKADDTQIPTVGYNFNSVFTVAPQINDSPDDISFKIKFLPSPLIIAELHSQTPLKIAGHRSFSVTDELGITTYVIGSKVGQLGTLDEHLNFQPKLDWSKFRCIGFSSGSQWVGREIDKSGVVYASRMNNEVQLATFDPTAKQDAIFSRAFQEQTFSGMHKEPVYDWTFVDENDGSAVGPDIQPNKHTVHLKLGLSVLPPLQTTIPEPNPSVVEYTQNVFTSFQNYFTSGYSTMNTEWIEMQFQAFDRQWNITSRLPDGTYSFTGTLQVDVTAHLVPRTTGKLMTLRPQFNIGAELTFRGGDFHTTLFERIATRLDNDFSFTATGIKLQDYYLAVGIEVTSEILVNREEMESRVRSTQILNLFGKTLLDDNNGLFVDNTWASPVAEFRFPRTGGDQCVMMQFVHVTNLELVVDDTSVLSNFAVSSVPKSRSDFVDLKSAKMQKVMQGIPPMITLDNGVIGQTAITELSSRGIISDIANLLGPIASTIFPSHRPMINGIQSLANKFDSLGII